MSDRPGLLDRLLRGPVVVLLSLCLFAEVNYIAARHYTRLDWTSARRFTLSPRSVEIARGLHAPTELYVLLNREEEHYADVIELVDRYAAAGRRLTVHAVDPDRQRDRLIGLAQEHRLQLLQSRDGDRTIASCGLLVAQGQRHWEVPRETLHELGQQDPGDEAGGTRVLNAQVTVERAISEALLQVDRASATKLCFAQGHAELPVAQGERSGAGFAEDLRHQNFQVREVEVHGRTGVPSDCDALVIAGPQRAWPEEDARVVERYLREGGNVALFVDLVVLEGRVAPTGLEGVARLAGMALPPAVSIEGDAQHLMPSGTVAQFRADTWNEHDLTRNLRGQSVVVELARPITRAEGSEVVPSALVQTTASAWGERNILELGRREPEKDDSDVQGPLSLAMAGEVPGATPVMLPSPETTWSRSATASVGASGCFTAITTSNGSFTTALSGSATSSRIFSSIDGSSIWGAALEDGLPSVDPWMIVTGPLIFTGPLTPVLLDACPPEATFT